VLRERLASSDIVANNLYLPLLLVGFLVFAERGSDGDENASIRRIFGRGGLRMFIYFGVALGVHKGMNAFSVPIMYGFGTLGFLATPGLPSGYGCGHGQSIHGQYVQWMETRSPFGRYKACGCSHVSCKASTPSAEKPSFSPLSLDLEFLWTFYIFVLGLDWCIFVASYKESFDALGLGDCGWGLTGVTTCLPLLHLLCHYW
jgi:hypothetical protein